MLGPFQVLKRPLTLTPRDTKPPTDPGPLAWWKFDDRDGATVADAAGNQYKGQIQGQPKWTQGAQGGALEFDGAKNWVECAGTANLQLRDGLTVATWFKVRRFDQPSQTLLAKGEAWELQRQGDKAQVEFTLAGPLTTGKNKGRPATVATKRAVDDGQWHHIAAVYDGQRVALYLDGLEESSMAAAGSVALNGAPVALGENAVDRGRLFNGWLDDARLYARGLSAEEVRTLHGGGTR